MSVDVYVWGLDAVTEKPVKTYTVIATVLFKEATPRME